MNFPRVSIVVLNWNQWKLTVKCIDSLRKIDYPKYDIIVVDNASNDGSVLRIKEYCNREQIEVEVHEADKEGVKVKNLESNTKKSRNDKRIIIIKNKENYGFAGGNNIGINFAIKFLRPKYILVLNNDTIVDKNILRELVKVAEKDGRIGSVQPKLIWALNPELLDSAGLEYSRNGFAFDRGKYEPERLYNQVEEVFGSCGAAAMYRCEALLDVAEAEEFFDEYFFAYYEDVDLAFRLRWAGWKAVFVPSAVVYHHRGASGGITDFYVYHSLRNHSLCFLKNMPLSPANVILWMTGSLMLGMYNIVVRRKFRTVLRAYKDIISSLKIFIEKRSHVKRIVSEREIYKFLTSRMFPGIRSFSK